MYTTGNIVDFIQRLHQQPTGQADLNNFLVEGRGYLLKLKNQPSGFGWQNISGNWEKEARLQKHRFSGTGVASGIMLNQQQF